jgi:cbb3-type cytochrome oxidase subunit 3
MATTALLTMDYLEFERNFYLFITFLAIIITIFTSCKKKKNDEYVNLKFDTNTEMYKKLQQMDKTIEYIHKEYKKKISDIHYSYKVEKENIEKKVNLVIKDNQKLKQFSQNVLDKNTKLNDELISTKSQLEKMIVQLDETKTLLLNNTKIKSIDDYFHNKYKKLLLSIIPTPENAPHIFNAFESMTISQIKNIISKEDTEKIKPGFTNKNKYILTALYNHYRLRYEYLENPFSNTRFIKSVQNKLNEDKITCIYEFAKMIPYFEYIDESINESIDE